MVSARLDRGAATPSSGGKRHDNLFPGSLEDDFLTSELMNAAVVTDEARPVINAS